MDQKEINERLHHWRSISAKYGNEVVPTATVYETFDEIAQPARLGFSPIKRGLYGRAVSDEITHLMKLQALKGASYSVWWGVSLAYVPHEWRERLRWHRSFKSARFELFETPTTYFPELESDWREKNKYIAAKGHGESYLRETMQTMWEQLHEHILAYFSATQSLAGVLQKAQEQIQRTVLWRYHYPNPMLIVALTLGRMGRPEDAEVTLNEYFKIDDEPPDAQANLKRVLVEITTR
jgi:hypothetical protein